VTDELHRLTLHAAADGLRSGHFSSVELTQSLLDRIEAVDGRIGAYLTVTPDIALEQAAAADKRLAAGDNGALLGLPIALKDVLTTAGVETTCASRILQGFIPPYDATAVTRLKTAGAVMLGKTNMDEFAMGSSNEHSAYKPVRNPWDLDKVPGGSSGGSAAAVAADECLAALGSDTGGSVRQPAALCGCVGLKPTYGRISRFGLIAFASSLDQIGVLTKDVTDTALLLSALAGHDPRDSTSAEEPVPNYAGELSRNIGGLRIGVAPEYFGEGLDPRVGDSVRAAIDSLLTAGATQHEITLPHTEYALPTYYVIAPSEASANLARYNGVKYGLSDPQATDVDEMMARIRAQGFGSEVKRRIMIGTFALSSGYYDAYYVRAQKVRTLIKSDFETAFKDVDVIAAPVVPTPAFDLGAKLDNPVAMYQSDIMTLPASLAGLPCLSIPCGFVDGLPVGLQLIAPPFAESRLLQAAHAYERARGELAAPVKAIDAQ
jgi:aspartyl-tRNA(Asn)/glutamyl-tRNA(Gln) amidotransferase subunit A